MAKLIQSNTSQKRKDNLADARSINGSTMRDGEVVYINGHTTQLDGGQGPWQWDATSTAADNNGTILKLSDTVTGRLIRDDDVVSGRHFGATGNGATNDSAAIQAALDFVDDLGGGTVSLPLGSYNLGTTSLMFGSQGVSLEGVGAGGQSPGRYGSRLIYEGTSSAIRLTVDDGLGWLSNIRNLHVDCNGVGSIGIRVGNGDAVSGFTAWFGTIENVFVTGAVVAGIKVVGAQIGQFLKVHSEFNDGIGWWITYDSRNVGNLTNTITSFYDCRAQSNDGKGWLIDQGFQMNFFSCTSEANGDTNWHITDSSAASILNFFGGWEEGTGSKVGFKIDGGTVNLYGFIHNSENEDPVAISGVTDLGGGIIRIASVAHGLVASDWIEISGTTNYNGDIEVTNVNDVDSFDVIDTYASSQSGTWQTIYNLIDVSGGSVKMVNPFLSEQSNKPTVRVRDGATCLIESSGEDFSHIGVESKARFSWGGKNRLTGDNNPFDAHAKTITAIADAGGGDITLSVTAHGYEVGDRLTIMNTEDYDNPIGTVTVVNDANSFDITDTYVSNQTGRCASSIIKYSGGDIITPQSSSSAGEGAAYGWICASVIGYPGVWFELGQQRILHKTSSSAASLYTIGLTDSTVLRDATAATNTTRLPLLGAKSGKEYAVQKIDASGNAVVVAAQVGEDINGSNTRSLTSQWDSIVVRDVGTHWAIVSAS